MKNHCHRKFGNSEQCVDVCSLSSLGAVCVCVCARARARVCVCVCSETHLYSNYEKRREPTGEKKKKSSDPITVLPIKQLLKY